MLVGREPHRLGDLWREGLAYHTQPGITRTTASASTMECFRPGAQRHLEVVFLVLAQDREHHRLSDLRGTREVGQKIIKRLDSAAVNGNHHITAKAYRFPIQESVAIAAAHPGLLRRAPGHDLDDQRA